MSDQVNIKVNIFFITIRPFSIEKNKNEYQHLLFNTHIWQNNFLQKRKYSLDSLDTLDIFADNLFFWQTDQSKEFFFMKYRKYASQTLQTVFFLSNKSWQCTVNQVYMLCVGGMFVFYADIHFKMCYTNLYITKM
jgi:hypothetical protein